MWEIFSPFDVPEEAQQDEVFLPAQSNKLGEVLPALAEHRLANQLISALPQRTSQGRRVPGLRKSAISTTLTSLCRLLRANPPRTTFSFTTAAKKLPNLPGPYVPLGPRIAAPLSHHVTPPPSPLPHPSLAKGLRRSPPSPPPKANFA